jgi:hypothetical protein
MTDTALRSRDLRPPPEFSSAPRLRLLPKGTRTRADGAEAARWSRERAATQQAERVSAERSNGSAPVLIAGADAVRRASLREELSERMPGTRFEELGTFWEVLARAASSRMVILSGDLDELPAESLLRALAHRHPDLPVVSLESPTAS